MVGQPHSFYGYSYEDKILLPLNALHWQFYLLGLINPLEEIPRRKRLLDLSNETNVFTQE
jgi:hypothetical protein